MNATTLRMLRWAVTGLGLWLTLAPPMAAQTVDAERLANLRDAVRNELAHAQAESLDANKWLVARLEELRDEVGYFGGRLRRGLPVADGDCARLEQQLAAIRRQVRRDGAERLGRPPHVLPREVPIGAEIWARVRHVTSDGSDAPRQLVAVTMSDLDDRGHTLIPAGATIAGLVSPVAATADQDAGLAVLLREVTVAGRTYAMDLRILELAAPGLDAGAVAFVGDGVVVRADEATALNAGATLRVRVESAIELTSDGRD